MSSDVSDIIKQIIIGVILFLLIGLITKTCWNASMPKIFRLPEIDYITALTLYILAILLIRPIAGA